MPEFSSRESEGDSGKSVLEGLMQLGVKAIELVMRRHSDGLFIIDKPVSGHGANYPC